MSFCFALTKADTATQTLQGSSNNNNVSQAIPPVKTAAASATATATAAPTVSTSKVISSTVASNHSSSAGGSNVEWFVQLEQVPLIVLQLNTIILLILSACAGALLPQVDANGKELPICNECKCSHLARNTTLIKV